MAANEENLKQLALVLQQVADPDKARRVQAEATLEQQKIIVGFPQLLLQLLAQPTVPIPLRQAAAVYFKNLVKNHWGQGEDQAFSLHDQDREFIRAQLVGLYLHCPPAIQNILAQSIALIGSHGLAANWPNLVPEMVARMGANDFDTIHHILKISNSLFKRYRYEFKSDALWLEIQFVLKHLEAPLLQFFQYASSLVDGCPQDAAALTKLFSSLNLSVKLFFSLCSQDMPSFYQDHLADYVTLFQKYLAYSNPILASDDDETPGPIEKLQYRICQAVTLCVEKYLDDYDFDGHLDGFVSNIWQLLLRVDATSKYDKLTVGAINFLCSVSRSVRSTIFQDPTTLQQICEKVIIPNISLREKDEEVFEDSPLDYIRQDSEGSDIDTRRRISCEFIKGLCKHYQSQVTQIFSAYVGTLLQMYEAQPAANWKHKDTAIYLITALAVKTSTQNRGITSTNELVNVVDFFQQHVLKELQVSSQGRPILIADSIRFVTTFRNQIPNTFFPLLVPLLGNFISSPSIVVSSYAAVCIERLLTVKDQNVTRYGKADIRPFLSLLLGNLFGALQKPDTKENHYLMRCIMRLCTIAQEETAPLIPTFVDQFNTIIAAVCKNPTNPSFNHYLFETIASLVKYVCAADVSSVVTFENLLFPSFKFVLENDVTDFTPYVFQILSQLLEIRPQGVSPTLLELLPILISPVMWERQGNVPGLTRLFTELFRKAANDLASSKYFSNILGVFQKLISSKATDTEGFQLLGAIYEYVPTPMLESHMATIMVILMKRLQAGKTNKYLRGLIAFFALIAGKTGPRALLQSLQTVQPG
eukprot:TRINITY_DN6535_c0_g1_i4.p1 TRINITY_DN6535_c0_g1~~TRINITY_DN6535_c0_g1_i4.p1  ORF type:complete len:815 (+),score=160.43 TRINITY_DN6535_c0_g1_i4:58-2502(+)